MDVTTAARPTPTMAEAIAASVGGVVTSDEPPLVLRPLAFDLARP